MSIPSDVLATPIAARKLARLGFERGELVLRPAFFRQLGAPYGAVARASCPLHAHDAPQVGCSCGFYAVATDDQLWRLGDDQPDLVVVDVELAGRVIEHEHGYRASDQRVTAVWVPSRCLRCGRAAEVLQRRRFGGVVPACRQCAHRPIAWDEAGAALHAPVRRAEDDGAPRAPWARRLGVVLSQLMVPVAALVVAATVALLLHSGAALAIGQLVILAWLAAGFSTLGPLASRLGIDHREAVRLRQRWGPLVFAVVVGSEMVLTTVVLALGHAVGP